MFYIPIRSDNEKLIFWHSIQKLQNLAQHPKASKPGAASKSFKTWRIT